jgi:hypothetical protein
MKIGYGYQILSDDDEYIKIAEGSSLAVAGSGLPGMTPPDLLPIRSTFPLIELGKKWYVFSPASSFVVHSLTLCENRKMGRHSRLSSPPIWPQSRLKEFRPKTTLTTFEGRRVQFLQVW